MKTLYRKEIFDQAIKENKIVRYHKLFEDVVKSYLKISEPTIQSDKLEAEKAELLEALDYVKDYLGSDVRSEIESLIQKHTQ